MTAVEELSIPTPWGHISAKAWGSPYKPSVLAIHGLNDNAASFDQLIPEVDDQLYVVCVDLPGHGLSSHFPPGVFFSLLDYASALKRVVDHLNWIQFSVIAHSFGSHIAIYFISLFEFSITHVLLIDASFANVINEDSFILDRCQMMFDKFFENENRHTRDIYNYEESINKLFEERYTKVGMKSIQALHKRAFKKITNGFIHAHDPRLKFLSFPLITLSFHLGLVRHLNCNLLLISTSEFEPFMSLPPFESTINELRKRLGSRMKVIQVEGCHDIHMESPTKVAPIIKQFFLQHISHL